VRTAYLQTEFRVSEGGEKSLTGGRKELLELKGGRRMDTQPNFSNPSSLGFKRKRVGAERKINRRKEIRKRGGKVSYGKELARRGRTQGGRKNSTKRPQSKEIQQGGKSSRPLPENSISIPPSRTWKAEKKGGRRLRKEATAP